MKITGTGDDGKLYEVTINPVTAPPPPPPTVTPKQALLAGQSYPIAAVDPTTARNGFDGGRGQDELIVYTKATGSLSPASKWGVEATVGSDMKVGIVRNRTAESATTADAGTPIPPDGFLFSGHGTAGDFLLRSTPGDSVILGMDVEIPPPPDPPAASKATLAVYYMIWANSPRVRAADLPAGCTEIRLSFLQGTPLKPTGDSPFGLAQLKTDLADLRKRNVDISWSLGGEGGVISFANIGAQVDAFSAAIDHVGGVDAVDVDIEKGFNPVATVLFLRALRSNYRDIRVSWAPNGTTIDAYTTAMKLALPLGLVQSFGQQFYMSRVTVDQASDRIAAALRDGLPPEAYTVGMMIGNDPANYWTLEQCVSNLAELRRRHGKLGAYLWEMGRTGTAAWAKGCKLL